MRGQGIAEIDYNLYSTAFVGTEETANKLRASAPNAPPAPPPLLPAAAAHARALACRPSHSLCSPTPAGLAPYAGREGVGGGCGGVFASIRMPAQGRALDWTR